MGEEVYTTAIGQKLVGVHNKNGDCFLYGCVIHNPSNHSMKDLPTSWRSDRGLMERICSHGCGHPDPDHINYVRRIRGDRAAELEGIHGCCCPHLHMEEE